MSVAFCWSVSPEGWHLLGDGGYGLFYAQVTQVELAVLQESHLHGPDE
jgi:hypothetical protein